MSKSEDEIMDRPTTKRVKLIESENIDRLSNLPESLILHILSFLKPLEAVQTCVLSRKYKDLWKHFLTLTLHSSDFPTYESFNQFLSLRNFSIPLQALDFIEPSLMLNVGRMGEQLKMGKQILKRSVNYAISHKVQRLGVKLCVTGHIAQIPNRTFFCQTLTHLKLSFFNDSGHAHFPKSLNLLALTNLKLEYFAFCTTNSNCAEPFSTLNSLNTLSISHCSLRGSKTLCISSASLVNLSIDDLMSHKIDLRTPSLCKFKFVFIGTLYQRLSGSNVSSLKHVDIDAKECPEGRLCVVNWLSELTNIKSLTVSQTILQALLLVSKTKLPSFPNLESLKVKLKEPSYEVLITLMEDMLQKAKSKEEAKSIQKAFEARLKSSSIIYHGILVDFLQNSPLAKVDFIECSR